jgi:glycosyltransferase involved in cell wall biosynthesis
MACGRPVVAVPVLALKTTVEDDVTGYHFEPGNSQDLLEKVEKCYESMGRLSRGCLKEARRNSIIGSVDALERIYEQMT